MRARWNSTTASAMVLAAACGGHRAPAPENAAVDLRQALAHGDPAGFLRATAPPELQFPRDHGPHPGFRTEWWYWTGNVATAAGRAFGFELVFFRQALAPPGGPPRGASLASRELVLAHAALTDVDGRRFHSEERMLRRDELRAGLRGGDAPLQLFLGDWSARAAADGDGMLPLALAARGQDFAFELELRPGKPIALQGEAGLSQKGSERGNASIYYSLPRLPCRGTVEVAGEQLQVEGLAWCDREWSTSALDDGQQGWDWFALQLDDGTELMWYQLRRRDGAIDAHSQGLFVRADGSTDRLLQGEVQCTARGEWQAPDGRAAYPAAWHLVVPRLQLELDVAPRVADQELHALVRYWEGAVAVRGTRAGVATTGLGYLEMTGYAR